MQVLLHNMNTERFLLKKYVKPLCVMVELEHNGILCASLGTPGDYNDGGDPFSNSPILNVYEEFDIVPNIDKFDTLLLFE